MAIQLFFIAASSVVGSVIQTTTGFGYGIFVMAIFPLFMPLLSASATTTLIAFGGTSTLSWRYRNKINFKVVALPIIALLISSSIAIYFAHKVPVSSLKLIFGFVFIIFSIYFFFFSGLKIKPTPMNGFIAGFLGGTLSGLFATGGPPIVIYLLSVIDDKEEYIATVQFYFLVSDFYTTILRIIAGIITLETIPFAFAGYLGLFIGMFIGLRILTLINISTLRRITYSFIGLSGLWTVISYFI